jgi:PAS domain S-box-containing protein
MKTKNPVSDEICNEMEYLRRRLREWEAVFENCRDGMSVVDKNGIILRSNPAMQRLYQLSAEDYVGKSVSDLVSKGIFSISISEKVIASKKPVSLMQEISTGPICLTMGVPVFGDDGEVEMVVISSHDVTELYLLKEKLIQSQKLADGFQAQLTDLRISQLQKEDIIVRSKKMLDTLDLARRLAVVDTTVLIMGESGVGKEVVARILHRANPKRSDKAFITINCGAIPYNLLEAELFGYERGAFTGASKEGKSGSFELADGGSIFLDEVGELPLDLQVKLLRVLQEKNFKKVGGIKEINVDVRVIAASNKDLLGLVKKGDFREDLYYRLNVVPLKISPLRERKEDIVALSRHFLQYFNERYGFEKILSAELIDVMERYNWPGNVRELKNIVERMVVTSEENILKAEYFPVENVAERNNDNSIINHFKGSNLKEILEDTEKKVINDVLDNSRTTAIAARRLEMSRATLARKMQRYGIKRR